MPASCFAVPAALPPPSWCRRLLIIITLPLTAYAACLPCVCVLSPVPLASPIATHTRLPFGPRRRRQQGAAPHSQWLFRTLAEAFLPLPQHAMWKSNEPSVWQEALDGYAEAIRSLGTEGLVELDRWGKCGPWIAWWSLRDRL